MSSDIEYLEWIVGRAERVPHDLGSSHLRWEDVGPPEPAEPSTTSPVRKSVADAYDVDLGCVLVTAGASHANFLAFAAELGEHSERVLVERPGYEPLRKTPALLGASVDRFNRPVDAEYPLEPDRVASGLEPDTALVAVTNRHNPSGRLVDESRLATLADTVADAGTRLLVDEVYAPFGGNPTVDWAFGGPTAAGLNRTVVTGSLTKFHGFDGLRIGWLVADEPFVERARSTFYHLPTVADPSLEGARRAFTMLEDLSARSRSRIVANADLLRSFVDGRSDLSGPVFDGSNYAFLRHERADGDTVSDVAWAEGVLVVPGRFFDDRERFRVSLGGEPERMSTALTVLGTVLDKC